MVDYAEFARRAGAHPGRCFLLARHAERPPIEPEDPTFGGDLPITEAGRDLSLACGRALRAAGPAAEWSFFASRLRRTRLTAAVVAEGLGSRATVAIFEEVSIPGLWLVSAADVHEHQEREGSAAYCDRLMRDGVAEGFRPIAESTALVLRWLRAHDFGSRLAFCATHDVFLACLLRGLGLAEVTASHWVGFLQGVGLFERLDGSFDAEYVVPDTGDWVRPFVQ